MSKREAAGFGLGSISTVASAVAGVPWGAVTAIVVVTVVLVAAHKITQAVFPQNSADRLKLWQGWMNLRNQQLQHKQQRRLRPPDPIVLQHIRIHVVPPRGEIAPADRPTPPQPPGTGEAAP